MGDRPLPLRAWQVSAALDDRLSVLVVPLKPQPAHGCQEVRKHAEYRDSWIALADGEPLHTFEPPLSVGQRLWARETWSHSADGVFEISQARMAGRGGAIYRADNDPRFPHAKWWSSAVMPREFSRLTLDVTEVRVCRLHDVTEDEARAAGHPISHDGRHYDPPPPEVDGWQGYGRASFFLDWSVRHGPGPYASNPWVCVARVAVHHRNIDSLAPRGNPSVASIERVQP